MSRSPFAIWGIGALLLAVAVAGCGDDKKSPTGPGGGGGGGGSTQFAGTLVGPGAQGSLALTIQSSSLARSYAPARAPLATIGVSGTVTFTTGAPLAFSGTYDSDTDSVHFTVTDSIGGVYEFHGHVDAGSTSYPIFGTWSGPQGIGGWGAYQGSTSAIKTYCGTLSGFSTGTVAFMVQEVIAGGGPNGRVVGVVFPTGASTAFPFDGWAVEYEPVDPDVRAMEWSTRVEGVYDLSFGGQLRRDTEQFYGDVYVTDLQDENNSIFANVNGGPCP